MNIARVNRAVTVDEALSRHSLLAGTSDSPLLDCQIILSHALDVDRSWLYAHGDESLSKAAQTVFDTLLEKRLNGVPVAYLVGHKAFWDMELNVSAATLIPRPETELLVEITLEKFGPEKRTVIDAGTGSGAIAIALSRERPAWQVYGTDISVAGLAVAGTNRTRLAANIHLVRASWLSCFGPGSFDAIVCNPPYIGAGDRHLDALQHEPTGALVADDNGLADITRVIAQASTQLRSGGWLVMEHGFDQGVVTRDLAHRAGLIDIHTHVDAAGQPRALVARRQP
ncbi:MAG TPA: peptide chain release factor N(5)-glutamine methyltransferase [Pseudomonadales bacterium]|nr:peptide chain release factor N(5)-glutamine methyltransferase [Pseudomonadales bacterium]